MIVIDQLKRLLPHRPAVPTVTRVDLPAGGDAHIAADVFTPAHLAADAALWICMGGGNVTRGYFDLGGAAGGARSFARTMTARGHVVVALEPVGVGDSTVPADGFSITIENEARWISAAITHLREQTVAGVDLSSLYAVGIGHSAGGMLIGATQGAHPRFDAIALMGFTTEGMPAVVPDDILVQLENPQDARTLATVLARRLFGGASYFEGQPDDTSTADGELLHSIRGAFPSTLGALAVLPGNIAPELAQITSPVFTATSSDELFDHPERIHTAFPRVRDFTYYTIPDARHDIFLSPRIAELYDRLLLWLPAARAASREVQPTPGRLANAPALKMTMGDILDHEEACAIVERWVPGMTTHKNVGMARRMQVAKVLGLAGIDAERQRGLLTELAALEH